MKLESICLKQCPANAELFAVITLKKVEWFSKEFKVHDKKATFIR